MLAVDLSDLFLSDLSAEIGSEWQILASYLNISMARVYQIKEDHITTRNRIHAMLVDWRNRASGPDADNYQDLMDAIKKSREKLPQVGVYFY